MKQVLFRKDLGFTSAFKQQNPHLCSYPAGSGDVGTTCYVSSYSNETKIMAPIKDSKVFILRLWNRELNVASLFKRAHGRAKRELFSINCSQKNPNKYRFSHSDTRELLISINAFDSSKLNHSRKWVCATGWFFLLQSHFFIYRRYSALNFHLVSGYGTSITN